MKRKVHSMYGVTAHQFARSEEGVKLIQSLMDVWSDDPHQLGFIIQKEEMKNKFMKARQEWTNKGVIL